MKPNFALDLSHDGIGLLHRGKGGWSLVGEIALDAPDLQTRLAGLRRTAAELESGGFTTKLIIPNSQILYTIVEAPGPDDISREVQIRAGLDGLTPYPVGELVFDWRAEGDKARVAVLARETMDEAEAFAADFRLNPVSFVARPGSGEFSGEPYFGLTRAATQLLPAGERLVPDASPVPRRPRAMELPPESRVEPDAPVAGPAPAEQPATVPTTVPEPATAPVTEPELTPPADASPEPVPTTADAPPEPVKNEPARKRSAPRRKPSADMPEGPVLAPFPAFDDEPGAARPAAPAPASQGQPAPAIAPPVIADDDHDVPPMPGYQRPEARAGSGQDSATFATRRATGSGESGERLATMTARIGVTGADAPPAPAPTPKRRVEIPPRPSNVSDSPVERIRADMADALTRPLPSPDGAPSGADTPAAAGGLLGRLFSRGGAAATPPEPPETAGADTAEKPQSRRAARKAAAEAKRARDAEALTVFGSRNQVGGKPRYLGLVLTLVLLLLMAAAALWSANFLGGGESRLFNPDGGTETATAPATSPAPAPVTETAIAEPEPPAAEPGATEPDTPAPDLAAPAAGEVLTPEDAQLRYAATGIWQRAPEPLSTPDSPRLGEVDTGVTSTMSAPRETVALPSGSAAISEKPPGIALPPPPAGTTFDLDDNGLVKPTADGAVSPTGITVYSGKPPVVPPPRPFEPPAEPAAQPAVPTPSPTAAPAPEGGGATPDVTAGANPIRLPTIPNRRPLPRPAGLAAPAVAAAPDTADLEQAVDAAVADVFADASELAVAVSRAPSHRPANFDRIVAAARTAASDGSSVVAASAPSNVSVAPSLPTRANVASEATVSNAINLRRINVIGIYGTPNARRALVRLSSGRYVKVKVGDRLDGGKVTSISSSRLTYQKGSRTHALDVLPLG